MPHLLSFGHGYSAEALAGGLGGWSVTGTHRDRDVIWPGTDLSAVIAAADHILISIPPSETGCPVARTLGEDIARARAVKWIGYLSTTGVYGDHGGAWIDENAPRRPATERGRWRVRAEDQWLGLWHEQGLPVHVFRLAGIYGPGRGPFEKVLNGTARRIVKPGQVFSRIHVADIAQVLAASMAQPNPGAAYNLCDDHPAPPEDVIAEAARLLGLPVPPAEDFATAPMTDMARSFYGESKRVSNDRIKRELGVRLIHPDFRSGLAALAEAIISPRLPHGG